MNIVKGLVTDAADLVGIVPMIPQEKTTIDLKDFVSDNLARTCFIQRRWNGVTFDTAKSQECAVIRSFVDFLLQKYDHKLTPQQKEALKRISDSKMIFDSVNVLELKNSFYEIRTELAAIVKTLFNLRMLEKLDEALQKLDSGVLTYLARVVAVQHQFERCLANEKQSPNEKSQNVLYSIKLLEALTDPKTALTMFSSFTQREDIASSSIALAFTKLGRLKEAFQFLNDSQSEISYWVLKGMTEEAYTCFGLDRILDASQNCSRIETEVLKLIIDHYRDVPQFGETEYREAMQIVERLTQPADKQNALEQLFFIMTESNRLPHLVDCVSEMIQMHDNLKYKEICLISLLTKPDTIIKPGMAEKAMTLIANKSWYYGSDYCLNEVLKQAIKINDRYLGAMAISCFHPCALGAFEETIETFNQLPTGNGLNKIA